MRPGRVLSRSVSQSTDSFRKTSFAPAVTANRFVTGKESHNGKKKTILNKYLFYERHYR